LFSSRSSATCQIGLLSPDDRQTGVHKEKIKHNVMQDNYID
jgi:hypothetical protein